MSRCNEGDYQIYCIIYLDDYIILFLLDYLSPFEHQISMSKSVIFQDIFLEKGFQVFKKTFWKIVAKPPNRFCKRLLAV